MCSRRLIMFDYYSLGIVVLTAFRVWGVMIGEGLCVYVGIGGCYRVEPPINWYLMRCVRFGRSATWDG